MFSSLAWTSLPLKSLLLMFKSAQNVFTSVLAVVRCFESSQVDALSGYLNHWGWWLLLALGTGQGQWTHTTQVLARWSAQVSKKCITHLKHPVLCLCRLDANCSQVIATIRFRVFRHSPIKFCSGGRSSSLPPWGLFFKSFLSIMSLEINCSMHSARLIN